MNMTYYTYTFFMITFFASFTIKYIFIIIKKYLFFKATFITSFSFKKTIRTFPRYMFYKFIFKSNYFFIEKIYSFKARYSYSPKVSSTNLNLFSQFIISKIVFITLLISITLLN